MKLEIQATGSAGNCYLLESVNSQLIIEVGVMPTNINFLKCEGYVVSHDHQDHAKFAGQLQGLDFINKFPYSSERWKIHTFPNKHGDIFTNIFLIRNIEEKKNIVFATDVQEIKMEHLQIFRSIPIHLLMIESNYNMETYMAVGNKTYGSRSHLSDNKAIQYVKFINPLMVVFIHPSERFQNPAKTMKKLHNNYIHNYYIAQKFPSEFNKYNANKIIKF